MSRADPNNQEMAPPVTLLTCAGCRRDIADRRYLRCCRCAQHWDIDCANVPECRFFNTMSVEHKNSWICPECVCNQRKGGDNSETPVKLTLNSLAFTNITTRRGHAGSHFVDNLNDSEMSLDVSQAQEDDSNLGVSQLALAHTNQPPSTIFNDAALSIINELRQFREEMREELKATRTQFDALRDGIVQLTGRIAQCESRVHSMDERVKTLELRLVQDGETNAARLGCIEQRLAEGERRQAETGPAEDSRSVAELERTVSDLKTELNDRDQEALLADLDIGHLPEVKGESVLHTVTVLASRLGVTLEERDVVFAERVGPPPAEGGRTRRVVVRLARRHVRDELLRAARTRRSLTAEGGGRIYVNERLTRLNRQVFQRVREECRRLRWRFSWSRRGRIFARKDEGAQIFQLRSFDDVTKVFGASNI